MCVRSSMIQRAKSEKFVDGYRIFSGQLVKDYIVSAMKRVFLRYCILNIKVKQSKQGPTTPLPDWVIVQAPNHTSSAKIMHGTFSTALRILNAQLGETSRLAWLEVGVTTCKRKGVARTKAISSKCYTNFAGTGLTNST